MYDESEKTNKILNKNKSMNDVVKRYKKKYYNMK